MILLQFQTILFPFQLRREQHSNQIEIPYLATVLLSIPLYKLLCILQIKFIFSKKDTKIDKIFTVNLTFTTQRQIDGEDFIIFCSLLRKHEL